MPKPAIWLFIISLPLITFGQQQTPPPEVEQALRARVTEFLQYHVDGNFRKAYELVADDTKDEYFNSGKAQLQTFKVNDLKFTDNFTKATVSATISKMMSVFGQEIPMTMPSTSTWKIENGKWVLYKDVAARGDTPLGLGPGATAAPVAQTSAGGADPLPKDLDSKALEAAARSILQQVSVDRTEVILASDKSSEAKVVFHNGMTGSVQLQLNAPEFPGFTAKLEQSIVRMGQDVPLVLRYEPADPAERRDPVNVQLTVQPLNRIFEVRVVFAAPATAPLK